MEEVLFKYLDNQIETKELEKWVYEESSLEAKVGEENYLNLISFDYNQDDSQHELQKLILENIINENEFVRWKIDYILASAEISLPKNSLFLHAKSQPKFLKGKTLAFRQFKTNKTIEFVFAEEVSQFVRHISELDPVNEEFLYLGTYNNSYIHLIVNQKDEVWIAYDVIDKQEYFALNISEAIGKLVIGNENN